MASQRLFPPAAAPQTSKSPRWLEPRGPNIEGWMIKDERGCREEKWSNAKMSSQGAAAVTALRARRRRRSRYLRAFWGDNSEESRDPGDFKERWTSFRICLDRRPPGTKQRLSDQSRAQRVSEFLSFEEEHHKKRENTAGQRTTAAKTATRPQAELRRLIFRLKSTRGFEGDQLQRLSVQPS